MLDVDAKDISQGMTAPPEQFIDESFLKKLYNVLDDEGKINKNEHSFYRINIKIHLIGVLIMNIACRNEILKEEVLEKIKKQFPSIFSIQIDQEVNEIIYCKKNSCNVTKDYCKNGISALNSILSETPAKNSLNLKNLETNLMTL